MTVRVGLIGYGLGGSVFHAPLIGAAAGLQLCAVATSREVGLPGVRVFRSPDELIGDPELDLIVVASPNPTHFPLARAALEAGKHVVVEKPFTLNTAQADELIDLARTAGRVLTVFHNRRWDGDFLTVRDLIASGSLGEVMLYEANWDRFRPAVKESWKEAPEEGSGLLNDLGPHLIDQALQLFGAPDAVVGDVARQRTGAATDDYFALRLHFGERRVLLSCSNLVAAPRPRFAVHGTGGSFVKYGVDPQEETLKAGGRPGDQRFGEEDPRLHGTLTLGDGTEQRIATATGHYLGFYEAVARAVLEGGPVPVNPADARMGLEIIETVQKSFREEGSQR